jgi:hypothetical protein
MSGVGFGPRSTGDPLAGLDWPAPGRLRVLGVLLRHRGGLGVVAVALPVVALESGVLALGAVGYVLGLWLVASSPAQVARLVAWSNRLFPGRSRWQLAAVAGGGAVLHGFASIVG